jgi:hypothetical protein
MPMTPRLDRWIRGHYPGRGELIVGRLSQLSVPLQDEPEERILAAIAVLGEADPRQFEEAVRLAQVDWRDVLVAAGLADGGFPARLDELLGPAD